MNFYEAIWGSKCTRFFDNWRESLKCQRLPSYETFAAMIERHWEGIAAYCRPENKVALGFVERFNNKIRILQRRAYGLRDEEYLRLKILSCMLPRIPCEITLKSPTRNQEDPINKNDFAIISANIPPP
jgi:hypothetical protein